jgi:agmatine deiminase
MQCIFDTPVERDVVLDTIRLAKAMGCCVQYYLEEGIYANPVTDHHRHLLQLYKDVTNSDILEVQDDFSQFHSPTTAQRPLLPSKLLVRFGKEELERAYQAFADLLCVSGDTPKATVIKGFLPAGDWFLEILHPKVNKGTGLQRMCQFLNVPMEHTVAMGDGTNDVEFLTMAGLGIAMKNAHESLQKVADYTMEWTNDQHGVMKTIESLHSHGQLVSNDASLTPLDLKTILQNIASSTGTNGDVETSSDTHSETTSRTTQRLFMPAEWSPHSACLILFPHNPQTFRLDKVQAEILHLAQQIVTHGKEDVYLLCKDTAQADMVQLRVEEMAQRSPHHTQDRHKIHVHVVPSDDTWARDTAPTFVWQTSDNNHTNDKTLIGLDWRFNAYGGPEEGCYWPCTNDQKIASTICDPSCPIANSLKIQGSISVPIILEGGSIHTDGEGTLLTTKECLLNPYRNPHLNQQEIEAVLKLSLGVQKVLWLPTGLDADDDTNGHIDNFCCFVEAAHVVLAWTDDLEQDPENYNRCREAMATLQQSADAKGRSFKITKLYLPSPPLRYSEEEAMSLAIPTGEDETEATQAADQTASLNAPESNYVMTRQPHEKMAASYINFYIANHAVLVPQFGGGAEDTDARAVETLQRVFEDRAVMGIPSREILLGGGNIHCQTQQVPLASTDASY